jgi:UrcA family protein
VKIAINRQSNSKTSMWAVGLFTLICATSGSGAMAADPSQPLTKIVHYGDLNLESEQGAKALYTRLRSAARHVCSPFEGIELSQQLLWNDCFNNAVTNAVGQVDKTMLSALHVQAANRSKS